MVNKFTCKNLQVGGGGGKSPLLPRLQTWDIFLWYVCSQSLIAIQIGKRNKAKSSYFSMLKWSEALFSNLFFMMFFAPTLVLFWVFFIFHSPLPCPALAANNSAQNFGSIFCSNFCSNVWTVNLFLSARPTQFKKGALFTLPRAFKFSVSTFV